jgi:hypothetical protein
VISRESETLREIRRQKAEMIFARAETLREIRKQKAEMIFARAEDVRPAQLTSAFCLLPSALKKGEARQRVSLPRLGSVGESPFNGGQ